MSSRSSESGERRPFRRRRQRRNPTLFIVVALLVVVVLLGAVAFLVDSRDRARVEPGARSLRALELVVRDEEGPATGGVQVYVTDGRPVRKWAPWASDGPKFGKRETPFRVVVRATIAPPGGAAPERYAVELWLLDARDGRIALGTWPPSPEILALCQGNAVAGEVTIALDRASEARQLVIIPRKLSYTR